MISEYYDLLVHGDALEYLEEMGYTRPGIPVKVLEPSQLDQAYDPKSLVFVKASNSLDVNKRIVRCPCDGIVDPVFKKSNAFDDAMMTIARDNELALVLTLARFLKSKGLERAKLLYRARLLVKLALKKGVRIVLTTAASHPFDLRTPYQLASFGVLLGLTWEKAFWSISETPRYFISRKGVRNANSTNN